MNSIVRPAMQANPEESGKHIPSADEAIDSYLEAREEYDAGAALYMAEHTADASVGAAYAQAAHEHIAHCEDAPTSLESQVEASVYETRADVSATISGDALHAGEEATQAAVPSGFEDAEFVDSVSGNAEIASADVQESGVEEALYAELLHQSEQNEATHHTAFIAEQAADEIVDHLVDGGVDVAVGVGCTAQPELCPALMAADRVYDTMDPIVDAAETTKALLEEAEATACYDAQQEVLAHGDQADAAKHLYTGLDCKDTLGDDHIDFELAEKCVDNAASEGDYKYCYATEGMSLSGFTTAPSEPTAELGIYDASSENDELDFTGQFDAMDTGPEEEGCVQVEGADGDLNFSCFAAKDDQLGCNESDLDFEGDFDVSDFESESTLDSASDAGFDGADFGTGGGLGDCVGSGMP